MPYRVYLSVRKHTTQEPASNAGQFAAYKVAIVGDDRYRRVGVGNEPVAIGDELAVDGIRCEVIGHLWRVGEPETLLCRCLIRAAAVDEPVSRERGWWSTDWH